MCNLTMRRLWLALLGVAALGGGAHAQTLTTMYHFSGATSAGNQSGFDSSSTLVTDGQGKLYGTTSQAGLITAEFPNGAGTIFKFTPATATTARAFQTLHEFAGGADGAAPFRTGLTYDAASGLLYGTTTEGGDGAGCGTVGCGTIFSLNPATGAYTTLYAFPAGPGQGDPEGALVVGSGGAIFGTAGPNYGGPGCGTPGHSCGTVFRFYPTTGQYTTVHNFSPLAKGAGPISLVFGKNGMLFGLGQTGGNSSSTWTTGYGVVFMIDPVTNAYSVVYKFTGIDIPMALGVDTAKNLYVTTMFGGVEGAGSIVKIVPNADGTYAVSTLFSFDRDTTGYEPLAPVSYDSVKKLLYTTAYVSGPAGGGTLVAIDPDSGAATVLYGFTGGSDGDEPQTGVLINLGMLYGSTFRSNENNSPRSNYLNGTLWRFPRF